MKLLRELFLCLRVASQRVLFVRKATSGTVVKITVPMPLHEAPAPFIARTSHAQRFLLRGPDRLSPAPSGDVVVADDRRQAA